MHRVASGTAVASVTTRAAVASVAAVPPLCRSGSPCAAIAALATRATGAAIAPIRSGSRDVAKSGTAIATRATGRVAAYGACRAGAAASVAGGAGSTPDSPIAA